ncbi:MAG: MFS transporter [Vicinamibacterales bacterium]
MPLATSGYPPYVTPRTRAEDLPLRRRIVAFVFLLCADFFYGWAWNTVDLLRPFIRDSLHLTLSQAGSMYSAQGAGALLGAIALGQLADRLGRRNVLVVVLAGYGVSLLAGVAVATYPQVLAQRFVLGLFLGGVFPIVVGLYVSLFDQRVRGRLAALYNATFNGSVVVLGLALGQMVDRDWRLLLWVGGLPPLCLAAFAVLVVPNDRHLIAYGQPSEAEPTPPGRLPIGELFHRHLRRRTLLLACMIGLNFFAFQAFNGWVTIYLRDVRHLTPGAIGAMIAWQFTASIAGGFFWGWFSDRFGRRINAIGFVLGAGAIVTYLMLPSESGYLVLAAVAYGFFISSSLIWGPWIAELYPARLRSTAASIFNWGRIISFFSPLITAAIAEAFGLAMGMMLAAIAFVAAAAVWRLLPETLVTERG